MATAAKQTTTPKTLTAKAETLRSVRSARQVIATSTPDEIEVLIQAEKEGRNRKTVIAAAEAALRRKRPDPDKPRRTRKVKTTTSTPSTIDSALKTAKTVNAFLESAGSAEIKALIQAEETGKNRKGVMAAATKALEGAEQRERYSEVLKTVPSAMEFMASASPDEIKAVIAVEKAGKNRKGVLNAAPDLIAAAKERQRMQEALGTIGTATEYIDKASAEEIRALLDVERAGKNRKGVIAAAEAALTPKSAPVNKETPVKKTARKRSTTPNLQAKRFQNAMLLVLAEDTGFDATKTVGFNDVWPKILERSKLSKAERAIAEAAWPGSPYKSFDAYVRRRVEWAHRNLRGGKYGGAVALTRTGDKPGEWGLTDEGIRAAHLLSGGTAESVKAARKAIVGSEPVEPETLDAGALLSEEEAEPAVEETLPPEAGETVEEPVVEETPEAVEEPVVEEPVVEETPETPEETPETVEEPVVEAKAKVKAEAEGQKPKTKRSRAARSISAAQAAG